jgi:hypothetical protein
MSEENWELVYETNDSVEAELLRGLLEANQVPVFLSQEGAGKAYGLTIGRLGRVQILVPESKGEQARQMIADLETGYLQDQTLMDE